MNMIYKNDPPLIQNNNAPQLPLNRYIFIELSHRLYPAIGWIQMMQ